jgi:hypothetical protein
MSENAKGVSSLVSHGTKFIAYCLSAPFEHPPIIINRCPPLDEAAVIQKTTNFHLEWPRQVRFEESDQAYRRYVPLLLRESHLPVPRPLAR